jgi:hypothetical protein
MVTVKILGSDIPSPTLFIVPLGNGSNSVFGEGIPGGAYRIQSVGDLTNSNWQTLGSATADSSGFFQFSDTTVSSQRFYRSVYP